MLVASTALVYSLPTLALAWDGIVAAKIVKIDVTSGSNYGVRIYLEGASSMCKNGSDWAFLNEADSNYKAYLAVLLLAKAQGTAVTVYSNLEYGQCHIGYIAAGN